MTEVIGEFTWILTLSLFFNIEDKTKLSESTFKW